MGFFEGFEKRAGFVAEMVQKASKGNIEAMTQTAKRMVPKKPAGTVDLGKYWNEPMKQVPRWKESLSRA